MPVLVSSTGVVRRPFSNRAIAQRAERMLAAIRMEQAEVAPNAAGEHVVLLLQPLH